MDRVAERKSERKEDKRELGPGEREPQGKDGPKVNYAAGKIIELLLGLHNEDRAHVAEALNKSGLLGGGESQVEKDQKEAARKAKEESDKWVKESKFHNENVSKEALKAAEEKHKAEVDTAKGKPK